MTFLGLPAAPTNTASGFVARVPCVNFPGLIDVIGPDQRLLHHGNQRDPESIHFAQLDPESEYSTESFERAHRGIRPSYFDKSRFAAVEFKLLRGIFPCGLHNTVDAFILSAFDPMKPR